MCSTSPDLFGEQNRRPPRARVDTNNQPARHSRAPTCRMRMSGCRSAPGTPVARKATTSASVVQRWESGRVLIVKACRKAQANTAEGDISQLLAQREAGLCRGPRNLSLVETSAAKRVQQVGRKNCRPERDAYGRQGGPTTQTVLTPVAWSGCRMWLAKAGCFASTHIVRTKPLASFFLGRSRKHPTLRPLFRRACAR